MSAAPEPTRSNNRQPPTAAPEQRTDVIDLRPGPPARHPRAAAPEPDRPVDTVILGRSVPHRYSAPSPPRVRHRGWMPSSLVIAGGGVLSVVIAGDIGGIPVVAASALVATIVCGAILVAAQITQEVRRARGGVSSAFEDRSVSSRALETGSGARVVSEDRS